ncbi:MAG TPA: beta-ketoacyl synthase N-terminal-like domain-containing protein, partial [Kofleriaceae bacterium]|nr:beta-ketoacyl synthase N-terminal-like domain-containing protein [Kofleriaceae bacterium]
MHTADTETDNNVAIIGLACRFPGSPDPARYWQLLENGEHAIREIPPSRWDPAVHYAPDLDAVNKSVSKWCGLVDDISRFDHRFFGISEREARNLDPQQRLLLEEAWHCIEDAGVPLERLRQARTAVFAGFMASDYHQESANPARTVDAFTALGNYSAILANRISYTLGLSGASVAVDAACASSLVAVHEARRALQRGDADYAIAAGVSLNFHPWKYISFSRARMLSPDGLCKTFDRDANGYVPGDGIGVLLLRPLAAARAAGDHVHGIIAGSAVNHTGRSLSITAPRVAAQRDVIRAAHRDAGWSARTISYLEAHGTGTSLGDPIEVEALTQAFREDTADRQFCGLGSVKSNIGHLEAAAGIAGVIKVLLMMRHRRIPATLHVRTPNPLIRFEDSPFALATEARDWQPDGPRRAGVSSFGFGGANAHVLVEEPGDRSARPAAARDVGDVFVFSARSQASLAAAMARCQAHLAAATAPAAASDASLEDVAATLATGRQAFAVRHGFIARSATELVEQLAAPAPPVPADKFPPTLHFTFVGSPDIASDLGAAHLLAPHLDRLQRALDDQGIERQLPRPGHPLRDGLDRFAAGHAFAAALVDLGAKPAAVTGDGEGIWIALAIAEVLPAEAILAALAGRVERTALRARRPSLPLRDPVSGATWMAHVIDGAYLRALLASAAPAHAPDDVLARARMLAASQFTFKKFLAEWNPTLATLGLSAEEVLGQDLAADDPRASLRWVMAASAMRQLHRKWQLADAPSAAGGGLEELVDLVVDGALSFAGAAALLTSADPDLVAIARAVDSQQHRIDRRQPYRLLRERAEGAGLVEVDDFAAWLDMALAQAPTAPVPGALAAPILDQPLRHTALRLWLQGVDVRWSALFPDGSFTRVPLPGYIFEGRDFWLPAPAAQAPARETPVLAPVIAAPTADAVVADPVTADPAIAERLITSHVIDGRAIAPGALLVSQALAAAERVHGPIAVLRDLRFER